MAHHKDRPEQLGGNDHLEQCIDKLFKENVLSDLSEWQESSLVDIATYKNGVAMQKIRCFGCQPRHHHGPHKLIGEMVSRKIENRKFEILRDSLLPKLMSKEIDVAQIKLSDRTVSMQKLRYQA